MIGKICETCNYPMVRPHDSFYDCIDTVKSRVVRIEGQVNDLRHAIQYAVNKLWPSGSRSLLQEALDATNPTSTEEST